MLRGDTDQQGDGLCQNTVCSLLCRLSLCWRQDSLQTEKLSVEEFKDLNASSTSYNPVSVFISSRQGCTQFKGILAEFNLSESYCVKVNLLKSIRAIPARTVSQVREESMDSRWDFRLPFWHKQFIMEHVCTHPVCVCVCVFICHIWLTLCVLASY